MKELLIHIGYSKCASSSIQNLLTNNALFYNDDRSYKYIVFDGNRGILSSDKIAERGNFPPHFFTTVIPKNTNDLKKKLEFIVNDKCDVGIISGEGLANPRWFTDEIFESFASLDVKISIFFVLRRFDQWLNSAWWQWGAFSEISFDRWIMNHKLSSFYIGVEKWLKLPNVKNFTCVDLCEDPKDILANSLGIKNYDKYFINASSSADMLRFLIKNKYRLKRTEHNPLIEFILNNELNLPGEKPPFVISRKKQMSILQEYEAALSLNLDNNIKRIFTKHLTDLKKELRTNKSENVRSEKFSMSNFLNQRLDPEFLERINEILVNRLHVPLHFSSERYMYFNPELKAAGINPYEHYLQHGIKKG